jgi:hypothetical protein
MKDPAALVYIDTWLSSTAEMDADCRGWYFNLILHQYDKESLPNDIEKLAQLAVVKFSQFERFKQVFEQVLKGKFEVCEDGRLRNKKASDIIRGRKKFTEKRSKSGSVGFIVKIANELGFSEPEKHKLKTDLYSDKLTIEEAKDKQVLKQMLELYRNGDEDEDVDRKEDLSKSKELKEEQFEKFYNFYGVKKGKQLAKKAWMKLSDKDLELIRKTIGRYLAETPDKKFRKHPSTYLNQKTWLDYVRADGKVDEAIPIVEPGWVYVGLSEAYDIIRDQNSVSLSEKEAIGAGDDYVRKMMNINPSYKNVGKGWKYRENR